VVLRLYIGCSNPGPRAFTVREIFSQSHSPIYISVSTILCSITSQKTAIFKVTAVKNSNLTWHTWKLSEPLRAAAFLHNLIVEGKLSVVYNMQVHQGKYGAKLSVVYNMQVHQGKYGAKLSVVYNMQVNQEKYGVKLSVIYNMQVHQGKYGAKLCPYTLIKLCLAWETKTHISAPTTPSDTNLQCA
jgi:hypothetical protein